VVFIRKSAGRSGPAKIQVACVAVGISPSSSIRDGTLGSWARGADGRGDRRARACQELLDLGIYDDPGPGRGWSRGNGPRCCDRRLQRCTRGWDSTRSATPRSSSWCWRALSSPRAGQTRCECWTTRGGARVAAHDVPLAGPSPGARLPWHRRVRVLRSRLHQRGCLTGADM